MNLKDSRRKMGYLGFITAIILVCCNIEHSSIDTLMYISAGLLGLTTFDKFSNDK